MLVKVYFNGVLHYETFILEKKEKTSLGSFICIQLSAYVTINNVGNLLKKKTLKFVSCNVIYLHNPQKEERVTNA